jgi:hypothetical protein
MTRSSLQLPARKSEKQEKQMTNHRNEDPVAIDRALRKAERDAKEDWHRALAKSLRSMQRDGRVKLYLDEQGEIQCELIEPHSN